MRARLCAGVAVRRNSGRRSRSPGLHWIFTILASGVIIFLALFARRIRSMAWALVFGLLLGGALGKPHRPAPPRAELRVGSCHRLRPGLPVPGDLQRRGHLRGSAWGSSSSWRCSGSASTANGLARRRTRPTARRPLSARRRGRDIARPQPEPARPCPTGCRGCGWISAREAARPVAHRSRRRSRAGRGRARRGISLTKSRPAQRRSMARGELGAAAHRSGDRGHGRARPRHRVRRRRPRGGGQARRRGRPSLARLGRPDGPRRPRAPQGSASRPSGAPEQARGRAPARRRHEGGLMVVAKSSAPTAPSSEPSTTVRSTRRYHAVVQGHPDPLVSSDQMHRSGRPPGLELEVRGRRRRQGLGRPTTKTLEAFRSASLLQVELETGRTHQIRVHMAAQRASAASASSDVRRRPHERPSAWASRGGVAATPDASSASSTRSTAGASDGQSSVEDFYPADLQTRAENLLRGKD